MNEDIRSIWNGMISKRDIVYINGDFAWKNHRYWINALNGRKILIRGNHDKMDQLSLAQFAEVHDMLLRRIDGQHVFMQHYCCQTWPGPFGRTWHAYGHSHGRIVEHDDVPSGSVGWDVWGMPVPWEVFKAKMEAKKKPKLHSKEELDERVRKLRAENQVILSEFGL